MKAFVVLLNSSNYVKDIFAGRSSYEYHFNDMNQETFDVYVYKSYHDIIKNISIHNITINIIVEEDSPLLDLIIDISNQTFALYPSNIEKWILSPAVIDYENFKINFDIEKYREKYDVNPKLTIIECQEAILTHPELSPENATFS